MFISVSTRQDIQRVSDLAREIWIEHFTSIIGADQVDYMLTHFQSASAIATQIESGAQYYLVHTEDQTMGYLALIHDTQQSMISKLYLKRSFRGQGFGRDMLAFAEDQSVSGNLWLTVNKHNIATIEWYRRHGFKITEPLKKDIGGGFFMDDYKMERRVKPGVI